MANEEQFEYHKLFKEQLESLGPEFGAAMEKYREGHFGDMFRYIVHIYSLENEIGRMTPDEQQQFIDICKILHNFGFYGGVSFTLDPDKEYDPHIFIPEK